MENKLIIEGYIEKIEIKNKITLFSLKHTVLTQKGDERTLRFYNCKIWNNVTQELDPKIFKIAKTTPVTIEGFLDINSYELINKTTGEKKIKYDIQITANNIYIKNEVGFNQLPYNSTTYTSSAPSKDTTQSIKKDCSIASVEACNTCNHIAKCTANNKQYTKLKDQSTDEFEFDSGDNSDLNIFRSEKMPF